MYGTQECCKSFIENEQHRPYGNEKEKLW